MESKQQEIWEAIMDVANKVQEGVYGEGDDINEKAISDDLRLIPFLKESTIVGKVHQMLDDLA